MNPYTKQNPKYEFRLTWRKERFNSLKADKAKWSKQTILFNNPFVCLYHQSPSRNDEIYIEWNDRLDTLRAWIKFYRYKAKSGIKNQITLYKQLEQAIDHAKKYVTPKYLELAKQDEIRDLDIERSERFHRQAMEFFDLAQGAKRNKDEKSFAHNLRLAFDSERIAANNLELYTDLQPSRAVIYRSAASLALDLDDKKHAKSLAMNGLLGCVHKVIEKELREVIDKCDE